MSKSTIIGIIAGAISTIYMITIIILGVCGVISSVVCSLLVLAPIGILAVFTLIFMLVKFVAEFGGI